MSNTGSSREKRTNTYHLMSIAPNVAFKRRITIFTNFTKCISQLSLKPGDEEIKKKGWWQFWK
jgi:hypothetical protein